jgi:4-amino-4-deoxy-L-arabinose transferase-like glycosyltransferase
VSRRGWLLLGLLAPLYLWRLDRPGFSDTEGMYAEPAREMVVSGDWVTPRINGEPFFTKPPLMYWLPAALWSVTGPTEYARLWPTLAALGTVAVTACLGGRLFGPEAGLAAAAVLGTSVGQFVESRMLRADMVLVLLVTTALWCWVRMRDGAGRGAALAFWLLLALGVLDKGLVPLVLVGGAIAGSELIAGTLRPATVVARLRALHLPMGLLVLVALTAPWHVIAAWRNPGFAWDYIVNQHILFFFDRKLPRDSVPDSLAAFWAKFFARGLPWSLLWPAAVLHTWRRFGRAQDGRSEGYRLVTAWLVVVLGFFSLASSRLEHYAMPALPAAALLVGALLGDAVRGRSGIAWAWLALPPALAGVAALALLPLDPQAWIIRLEPTLGAVALESLARPALLIAGAGLLAIAALFVRRRPAAALAAGAAVSGALIVVVQLAHERVEPLFSWRPIAMRIASERPGGARVFFRASDEYQLCGGLAYYLGGQRLDLLMPPGWMAPTFLGGRVERLFTAHDAFEAAWRAGGTFLVSDDVWPPGAEASLVPGPYAVVDRAGSKVLLRAVGPRDGRPPGPAGRFSPAPFTEGALGTSIPAAAPVAGARP